MHQGPIDDVFVEHLRHVNWDAMASPDLARMWRSFSFRCDLAMRFSYRLVEHISHSARVYIAYAGLSNRINQRITSTGYPGASSLRCRLFGDWLSTGVFFLQRGAQAFPMQRFMFSFARIVSGAEISTPGLSVSKETTKMPFCCFFSITLPSHAFSVYTWFVVSGEESPLGRTGPQHHWDTIFQLSNTLEVLVWVALTGLILRACTSYAQSTISLLMFCL